MADPITLGTIGTLATAGGAGTSAFGALMGGKSQSQAYQYQAGVANLNQQIALQNRDYTLAVGDTEASRYGMQARQRMGAIRAGEGASGIDIGSGSKAAVQDSQQLVAGLDLTTIRNNTARKAYGFDVQASEDAAQSGLYSKAASDAETSGIIKAAGSLVSGTASVADKWLQGNSTGLFGGGNTGNLPKVNPDNSNYYVS